MTVLHSAFEFLEELPDSKIKLLKEQAKKRMENETKTEIYNDIYNDSDDDEEIKRMRTDEFKKVRYFTEAHKNVPLDNDTESDFSENSSLIENYDINMICQDLMESKTKSF
jgi:hypothetical protein